MSGRDIDRMVQKAITAGILPETAVCPTSDGRPWPLVLLTAIGAWLAAIPLLIMAGLLFGNLLQAGAGPYFIGLLVLAAAIVILRAETAPAFVEQLAMPALLVGGGVLGLGVFRDLPVQGAALLLALLACAVGVMQPRAWLRVLLGACAAMLTMLALVQGDRGIWWGSEKADFWVACHAVLLAWVAALAGQRVSFTSGYGRHAAALESLGTGWIVATLAGLALWSGMTFLAGGTLGGGISAGAGRAAMPHASAGFAPTVQAAASAALAVVAAISLARCWSGVRQGWCAGVALVLTVMGWLMPSLGAVWLTLAVCASTGRLRLAIVAGLAAAWIIGAFYYQLSWPLADKALLLLGAAAALGGLAWLAVRREPAAVVSRKAATVTDSRMQQAGIVLSALLVLAIVNAAIWQKEDLIAHGQPVFVELAPVDPRSLMQGDYMQLHFSMPAGAHDNLGKSTDRRRPHVVARRDARGIATVLRRDDGTPLAPDEILIELTPKAGSWILVSDAWFFKEGEAERWSKAKYGEFRVGSDGRALLVGLRGADLAAL